jgi:hypothetical protein
MRLRLETAIITLIVTSLHVVAVIATLAVSHITHVLLGVLNVMA